MTDLFLKKIKELPLIKKILIPVLAFLACYGLSLDLTILFIDLGEEGEQLSRLVQLLVRLNRSTRQDRVNSAFLFVSLLALVTVVVLLDKKRRDIVCAGLFSFFFATMHLVGISFENADSSLFITDSLFALVKAFLYFTGVFILTFCLGLILIKLYDLLDRKSVVLAQDKTGVESVRINRKRFIKYMVVMFLCWLPWFILFFPGTSNGDTAHQVRMFFHLKKGGMLDMSAVRAPDIYITNMQPYLTTLIIGVFCKLGVALSGNVNSGIAVYSVLMMLVFTAEFSYLICYFRELGFGRRVTQAGFLFFALFPLFPMHAICMVKDSMFAAVYIPLSLGMLEIMRTKGEVLKKTSFVIVMTILSVLFTLTKNQGVYFLIIILLAGLFMYRKSLKKLIKVFVIFGLPAVFFMFVWSNMLLPVFRVSPGGRQEVYGTLFQCTARYVRDFPDDVTESEEAAVRKLLKYDTLAKDYNPELQDRVKYKFNQDATSEDMKNYFRAFISMGMKHPRCYAEAVINNCYGFFYLNRRSTLVYKKWQNRRLSKDSELYGTNPFVGNYIPAVTCINTSLQETPVLNLIFSVSSYTIFAVFMILLCIRNKKYANLFPMLVTILSILILVICPANGNMRYTQPMLMLFIFNVFLQFMPKMKE